MSQFDNQLLLRSNFHSTLTKIYSICRCPISIGQSKFRINKFDIFELSYVKQTTHTHAQTQVKTW